MGGKNSKNKPAHPYNGQLEGVEIEVDKWELSKKEAKQMSKKLSLPLDQIQRLYQQFRSAHEVQLRHMSFEAIESNGPAKVTFDVNEIQPILDVMAENFPGSEFWEIASDSNTELTQLVLSQFDLNQDGVIDFEELLVGLILLSDDDESDEMIEAKASLAFDIFDLDRNGYLSIQEVVEVMDRSYVSFVKLQKVLLGQDPSTQGEAELTEAEKTLEQSIEEFKNQLKDTLVYMFVHADLNRDNKLSKPEFIDFSRENNAFLMILNPAKLSMYAMSLDVDLPTDRIAEQGSSYLDEQMDLNDKIQLWTRGLQELQAMNPDDWANPFDEIEDDGEEPKRFEDIVGDDEQDKVQVTSDETEASTQQENNNDDGDNGNEEEQGEEDIETEMAG